MSRDGPTNVAASVHARLRNVARKKGENFNLLLIRHALERFLYRLSRSKYHDQFVLKGAFLFVAWENAAERPTRDLDLLAFGDPDITRLEQVFREVCTAKVEPDGLVFDPATVLGAEIREGAIYDGVRMKFVAHLGNARTRMQVDVGFGDAVVPPADLLQYPTILDQDAPQVLGYPPEAVIAEKFHAMVTRGVANSRLKDYCDVWRIGRAFQLELPRVAAALAATFERRATSIPTEEPEGLTREYADQWKDNWARLSDRFDLDDDLPPLEEVIREIRGFLMPACRAAAEGHPRKLIWNPADGWV
jgi:predicted nucleotidyltransferase component of viral defense system